MGVGITFSGPHDGTAAQLVVIALLLLMSLMVIEPATTPRVTRRISTLSSGVTFRLKAETTGFDAGRRLRLPSAG